MKKNIKSFSLYTEWYKAFTKQSDEIAGSLIKAVFRYVCDGDAGEISNPIAEGIFSAIEESLSRNVIRYEEVVEKRRKAGLASVNKRIANQHKSACVDKCEHKPTDSDSVSDKEDKSSLEYMGDKPKRFIPPSLDEVQSYVSEKGFKIEASTFIDFYSSKGWMVGKNKMKDWKAAVRTWNRNDRQQKPEEVGITLKDNSTNKYDNDKLW